MKGAGGKMAGRMSLQELMQMLASGSPEALLQRMQGMVQSEDPVQEPAVCSYAKLTDKEEICKLVSVYKCSCGKPECVDGKIQITSWADSLHPEYQDKLIDEVQKNIYLQMEKKQELPVEERRDIVISIIHDTTEKFFH